MPESSLTVAERPRLEVIAVSAGYGPSTVIRDISLSVEPGQILALLGSNGAGKSTLLKTVAGVIEPRAGAVRIDGADASGPVSRRARSGLGYAPEERGIFPSLTVKENFRVSRAELQKALELFPELKPLLSRPAGLLSGGEQQMLVLARILASSPRLVLIDELSLGLAPLVVDRLLETLLTQVRAGLSVVLVEQDVQRALRVADRVVVLRRGRISLEGASDEIRADLRALNAAYLGDVAIR